MKIMKCSRMIPTKRNMEHIMESTQEPMHRMLLGVFP